MDAVLRELRQVVTEAADFDRPWLLGEVVDTSRYSTVGGSWVGILWGDQIFQCMYSDGPEPPLGTLLQFKRANRHPHSWYFAKPIPFVDTIVRPNSCTDSIYYLVGRDVDGGGYRILRFASLTGIGDAWTDISACPSGAVGGFEPELMRITASDEYAKPWHGFPDGVVSLDTAYFSVRFLCYTRGGELSYSDDLCATWTGTGFSPLHVARAEYYGRMYACTASALWESSDYGATWDAIPDSAPPAGSWVFVASPDQKDALEDTGGNTDDFSGNFLRIGNTMPDFRYRGRIQAVSSTGIWYSINSFHNYEYPLEADPPFDSHDAGADGVVNGRGWNDPGSNQGHFTDIGGFATDFPFVVTKTYRDAYGPYGAAVEPTDAFYTGSDSGSEDAWVRPTVADAYLLTTPLDGDLPDAGDPYDTGALKAGAPWLPFDYGSEAAHVNEQSTGREGYLCVDTSGVGGVVIGYGAYNSPYANDQNHPYFATGIGVLDACNCATGPVPFGVVNCFLVALDDETEGADHCSFAITDSIFLSGSPPWGAGGWNEDIRFEDATTTMRHDLGAYYVGTRNGIAAYSPVRDLGG